VKIVVLHPGAMGAAVGAQAVAAGHRVFWVEVGRSAATRRRAAEAGLQPTTSLADADLIFSICPPAAAYEVAQQVAGAGFKGTYVDANAISPARAESIAELFGDAFVDGGIIGGPPRGQGLTRLYLSGARAADANVFAGTALQVGLLPGPVGQASGLKLAFAAYNKISYALAAQAGALAEAHGVLPELRAVAEDLLPGTPLAKPSQLASAGPRAWRWAPEMHEIADAFRAAGIAPESPLAAERLFALWSADPAFLAFLSPGA
jgi:3-hydroxyisobutyrate dehydrogenase-like beta-hydroxyacid dehydrogenase